MENQTPATKGKVIKSIYFHLVSFVALMMVVISSYDAISIALKTWVFTAADKNTFFPPNVCLSLPPMPPSINREIPTATATIPTTPKEDCEKQNETMRKQQEASLLAQKQQSVVRDIAMLIVAIPLFLIHWTILRKKDENL